MKLSLTSIKIPFPMFTSSKEIRVLILRHPEKPLFSKVTLGTSSH